LIFSFKDFKGYKTRDYESAKEYMKLCFTERKKAAELSKEYQEAMKYDSGSSKREIFIHETCATDTENVKRVFEDVQVTILREILKTIRY